MNLNKAIIVGRVTADPELRSTAGGQQVTSFGVATNRVWYDTSRQKQESTEFHNVVVWGRQAETASQFLKKGSLVLIEGRLQTRDWEGKDGQKRRTTEIIAERIQFGPRSANSGERSNQAPEPNEDRKKEKTTEEDVPTINLDEEVSADDLPF